jgi:thiaminase
MVRVLRAEPNFSERFTAHLLARTMRVEEDLIDQLFNSSEKRLARLCSYWRTSARMESRSLSSRKSARRRSRI